MLTEEAHHLSVGQKGIERVLLRAAELEKIDPNGDVRAQGGIDIETIQKYVNYWYSYSLDLFGSEISTNAADFFASGLKGRWKEAQDYTDHSALNEIKMIPKLENGVLVDTEVPLRNAMNEVLREDYIKDCETVIRSWNRALRKADCRHQIKLPHPRFFRRQGIYKDEFYDLNGQPISAEAWHAKRDEWLPTESDRQYVISLMTPVYEPGQCAHWIAAPKRGINRQPFEYEYVRT
jgi:benzoyl-CoA 2,3-dioxygenase component B